MKLISFHYFIDSTYRLFISKWLMHDWKGNWAQMCAGVHKWCIRFCPSILSLLFLCMSMGMGVCVRVHVRVCEFADMLNLFMGFVVYGIMKGDWMCICYPTCIKIGCCFIVSIYRKFVSKWLMHDWKWNWLWMCLKIHVVYDSDCWPPI